MILPIKNENDVTINRNTDSQTNDFINSTFLPFEKVEAQVFKMCDYDAPSDVWGDKKRLESIHK